MPINPALNLKAFAVQSPTNAPPITNALYLRDGRYDASERMDRASVAKTFAAFRERLQTEDTRLALFFHGGLVDKAHGAQGAANEFDTYEKFVFPLFFIWESGIREVLAHHLPAILSETIFSRVNAHATAILQRPAAHALELETIAFSANAETARSVPTTIALTPADIDEFVQSITNDGQVQQATAEIARNSVSTDTLVSQTKSLTAPLQQSPSTRMSPEIVGAIRGAYAQTNRHNMVAADSIAALPFDIGSAIQAAAAVAKASIPVLLNVARRYAGGRDHGLTCTIVEEVLRALYGANAGSAIWTEMKDETEEAFTADSLTYGGTAVIEELCSLVKERPQTKVTLVGHSTGGVYIGNFLRHVDVALAAQGDTSFRFDIILMAPANTFDFFADRYIARRVNGIRLFGMQDATEQQDHLISKDVGPDDASILGKVYPRSLLYLVSGICETFEGGIETGPHALDTMDMPVFGMDRFYADSAVFGPSDYSSVDQARRQFVDGPAQPEARFVRVLSPTAENPNDGFRSTARKHGDFPGDTPTQNSIIYCFENGLVAAPP